MAAKVAFFVIDRRWYGPWKRNLRQVYLAVNHSVGFVSCFFVCLSGGISRWSLFERPELCPRPILKSGETNTFVLKVSMSVLIAGHHLHISVDLRVSSWSSSVSNSSFSVFQSRLKGIMLPGQSTRRSSLKPLRISLLRCMSVLNTVLTWYFLSSYCGLTPKTLWASKAADGHWFSLYACNEGRLPPQLQRAAWCQWPEQPQMSIWNWVELNFMQMSSNNAKDAANCRALIIIFSLVTSWHY